MRGVGRGVPRAYGPPIRYMPAWMPHLGRCLQCFITLKLLDSPRVLWRGWPGEVPLGQGVDCWSIGV
jgi:hypothetical protein